MINWHRSQNRLLDHLYHLLDHSEITSRVKKDFRVKPCGIQQFLVFAREKFHELHCRRLFASR